MRFWVVYLACGLACYLVFINSTVDFHDPWLYVMTGAWPVIIIAALFKWGLIGVVAIAVLIGCWGLVEYLRK